MLGIHGCFFLFYVTIPDQISLSSLVTAVRAVRSIPGQDGFNVGAGGIRGRGRHKVWISLSLYPINCHVIAECEHRQAENERWRSEPLTTGKLWESVSEGRGQRFESCQARYFLGPMD